VKQNQDYLQLDFYKEADLLFKRFNYFLLSTSFLIAAFVQIVTKTQEQNVSQQLVAFAQIVAGLALTLSFAFFVINFITAKVINLKKEHHETVISTNEIVPANWLGGSFRDIMNFLLNPFGFSKVHWASHTWAIPIFFIVFWFCVWGIMLSWIWPIIVLSSLIIISFSYVFTSKWNCHIGGSKPMTNSLSISTMPGTIIDYHSFSHEAIVSQEPPYFLGDTIKFKVKITNLLAQPQDGRFFFLIFIPGGMLFRPVNVQPNEPLYFGSNESKIIELGDPIFCAFLGVFRLAIAIGETETMLINQGKIGLTNFSNLAIYAGLSQDREAYHIQKKMVTLTGWIEGLTISLVILTIALIVLTIVFS
jgi:hypothetical protein